MLTKLKFCIAIKYFIDTLIDFFASVLCNLGPSSYLPPNTEQVNSVLQQNSHPQDQGSTYKASGVLSSAAVNSTSYPPKARSNFLLGPTKSVIFANNNSNNMQVLILMVYTGENV